MKYFVYLIIAVGIFYLGWSSNDNSDTLEALQIKQNQLKSRADSLENAYRLRGDTLELIIRHYRDVSASRGKLADQNKTLLKQLYEAKKPTYYSDSAIVSELAALGYNPTN